MSFYPGTIEVLATTRVGVAVDFDADTITYTKKTGATVTPVPAAPLGFWYREVVGPAITTKAGGKITLITRPPFALTVPAGIAADY